MTLPSTYRPRIFVPKPSGALAKSGMLKVAQSNCALSGMLLMSSRIRPTFHAPLSRMGETCVSNSVMLSAPPPIQFAGKYAASFANSIQEVRLILEWMISFFLAASIRSVLVTVKASQERLLSSKTNPSFADMVSAS